VHLAVEDLLCLLPEAELSGQVINFYFGLLQTRDAITRAAATPAPRKSDLYIGTFFYRQLCDPLERTGTVTAAPDVLGARRILIPVNVSGCHWALVAISMDEHEIHHYDSLSWDGTATQRRILQWLLDVSLSRNSPIAIASWSLFHREATVPQQNNGVDCGVFTILCADFLSDDLAIDSFRQHEITAYLAEDPILASSHGAIPLNSTTSYAALS
jgi:sentrin-specific protease 1